MHRILICFATYLLTLSDCCGQVTIKKHVYLQYQSPDSFLTQLQVRFDTVIAVANENLNWGAASYEIISVKDGLWRGFRYKIQEVSPAIIIGLPDYDIDSFNVNYSLCNQAMSNLITQSVLKASKDDKVTCMIKEEQGYSYPSISDASSLSIYLITPTKVYKKAYYAPGFYDQYCHNKAREMFINFVNSLKVITGNQERWY